MVVVCSVHIWFARPKFVDFFEVLPIDRLKSLASMLA